MVGTTYARADDELMRVFDVKYRRFGPLDWGPKTRLRFGYFNPDDHYETLLAGLARPDIDWLDVGCGRDIFPSNPDLAAELAARCSSVTGVDPDPNILENPFLTDRHQCLIDDYVGDRQFDVVSMRMVAEHIQDPPAAIGKLSQIVRPGGKVVVYTPHKWAPISVVARCVPFRLHQPIKAWLWNTEEQDTFPVEFRMNTRKALRSVFEAGGFGEAHYELLADCRVFNEFRILNFIELSFWKLLTLCRIPYPEVCVLAVFEKRR